MDIEREEIKNLGLKIQTVLLLNVADAICSLAWFQHGVEEANPLLSPFVKAPLLFLAVKLTVVSLGCMLLWLNYKNLWARRFISVAFVVYSLITVMHIIGFMMFMYTYYTSDILP